jgi:hypothetical protein
MLLVLGANLWCSNHLYTTLTRHKRNTTVPHSQHVTVWPWAPVWQGLFSVANHTAKMFQYCSYFNSPRTCHKTRHTLFMNGLPVASSVWNKNFRFSTLGCNMIMSLLSLKGKWGLWDHQSVCLSPLITFEPVGRFLRNSAVRSCHWRWPRCHTFNPVSSTIPKWRTFKLLRWIQNLHQPTWDCEILYTD